MSVSPLTPIASTLLQAGAPAMPTVILMREAPVYEVDIAALQFTTEASLPISDWAALALARALGGISPADIDAYLGLGDVVAEGIVRRLRADGLLEDWPRAAATRQPAGREWAYTGFFDRLFGRKDEVIDIDADVPRLPTQARKLRDPVAPDSPQCRLSASGEQALDRGKLVQRSHRRARLRFLADPLLFLGVEDERNQHFTQHQRPAPLNPDQVPESLRVLDATLALPPEERMRACGIGTDIRGLSGELAGIVSGTQWEVRSVFDARRQKEQRGPQFAQIILAAVPGPLPISLQWQTYLGLPNGIRAYPHIEAAQMLPPDRLGLRGLLKALISTAPIPDPRSLRGDGAFDYRCDSTLLPALMGKADRPADTLLAASVEEWTVGLRVHGKPSDIHASRETFFDFLKRRDADLRADFDGTCQSVATNLITYWEENLGLPSIEDAAISLWQRAELRAALCKRRMGRDLITAYEHAEVAA